MMCSDRRIFTNVKVIPGVSLNSDHRLLDGDLRIGKIKPQQSGKRKEVKTKTLQDEERKNFYRDKITETTNNRNNKLE